MICIPKALAQLGPEPPVCHQFQPPNAARASQPPKFEECVHTAAPTPPFVAQEDLVAQIGGLRSKSPLMHAIRGTESEPARRHLERAPTAQAAPIESTRHVAPAHTPTLHRANETHLSLVTWRDTLAEVSVKLPLEPRGECRIHRATKPRSERCHFFYTLHSCCPEEFRRGSRSRLEMAPKDSAWIAHIPQSGNIPFRGASFLSSIRWSRMKCNEFAMTIPSAAG